MPCSAGYDQSVGAGELRTWTAFHLLARILQPFRGCAPDWRGDMARRLHQIEDLLRWPRCPRSSTTVRESNGCGCSARPKSGGRLTFEAAASPAPETAGSDRRRRCRTVALFAVDPTCPVAPVARLPRCPTPVGCTATGGGGAAGTDGRSEPRYVKLFAPGKSEVVAAASSLMHAVSSRAGFRAPAVLSSDPDRVVFSEVPGRAARPRRRGVHDRVGGGMAILGNRVA